MASHAFKLFGKTGSPGKDFAEDVVKLLNCTDQQIEQLGAWFGGVSEEHVGVIQEKDLERLIDGGLAGHDAAALTRLARFIAYAWESEVLTEEDVVADIRNSGALEALEGVDRDEGTRKLRLFLSALSKHKAKVFRAVVKGQWRGGGIPSLQAAEITQDIRGVFRASPWAVRTEPEGYDELLALLPVFVVRILAEKEEGSSEFSFLMTERDLGWLLEALKRSVEQMEILKKRVGL